MDFRSWFPFLGTLGGGALILLALHLILTYKNKSSRFTEQFVMLLLSLVLLVALIAALPISEALRSQLLGLIGVLLSAAIALSSTTFVGNALAGLMLRTLRKFRPGDFVRVGEQFGRVSERGLFHTELQTEDSDLTTIPNLYLVTNPVTVVRAAGTIVSAQVSLGYDISHQQVETVLGEAALKAGLKEPFVQLLELGDFSILYRLAGLLEDVTTLLSTRSKLRGCILDALHEAGIEIVSPNFMNTRSIPSEQLFIPRKEAPASSSAPSNSPENIVFEKAEIAAVTEQLQDQLGEAESGSEQLKDGGQDGEYESLKRRLAELEAARDQLADTGTAREQEKSQPPSTGAEGDRL